MEFENIISLLRGEGEVRSVDRVVFASAKEYFIRELKNLASSQQVRIHPLGFFVATKRIDTQSALRFHVWPNGFDTSQSQAGGEIHDHIFELNSLVVAGALQQKRFTCRYDASGTHDVLEVGYTKDGSNLCASGSKAILNLEKEEQFNAGTIYKLPIGSIHHAAAVTHPTASLVLTTRDLSKTTPIVFVPIGGPMPSDSFARSTLNNIEEELLGKAIADIASDSS